MKVASLLLLALSLLSTAHAQTPAAKPNPFSDAKSKAIGRKFLKKSKPYDSIAPVPVSQLKQPATTYVAPKNTQNYGDKYACCYLTFACIELACLIRQASMIALLTRCMTSFEEQITQRLEDLGLSMPEIANLVAQPEAELLAVCAQGNPRLSQHTQLAEALRVPLLYFLNGSFNRAGIGQHSED